MGKEILTIDDIAKDLNIGIKKLIDWLKQRDVQR